MSHYEFQILDSFFKKIYLRLLIPHLFFIISFCILGFVLVTVGTSSSGLRFKQKVYTTSLKEHAPKGSDVQTVEAEHYGGNIAGTITYSIVSGNEKNTFSINQGR